MWSVAVSNLFPQAWACRWHVPLDFWWWALVRRVTSLGEAGSQGLVQAHLSHSQTTQTLADMVRWKVLEHVRNNANSEARTMWRKERSQLAHTQLFLPRGDFLAGGTCKSPKISESGSWKERLTSWGAGQTACAPLRACLCGLGSRTRGCSWGRTALRVQVHVFGL